MSSKNETRLTARDRFHQHMANLDLMERSGLDDVEHDEYTRLTQLAGEEFRKMMRELKRRKTH